MYLCEYVTDSRLTLLHLINYETSLILKPISDVTLVLKFTTTAIQSIKAKKPNATVVKLFLETLIRNIIKYVS
jgi:hypothetical protein